MTKKADELELTAEPGIDTRANGKELLVPIVVTPREADPPLTQAEWLTAAKEAEAVLLRGDHVSPELIESLFLQSIGVIENPPNPPDPVADEDGKSRRRRES